MLSLLLAAFLWGDGGIDRPDAPAPCALQGVWRLESLTVDGKVVALGSWRQMKVIGAKHFAWVGQGSGPTELRSLTDSLAAYRASGFGGGTYRVSDSTYAERLEYFADPAFIGRELTATCRIAGDRWTHVFEWPELANGREARRVRFEEVWRRVE